jgi:gliding motility-associated-like protein
LQLIEITDKGCRDTVQQELTIHPKPLLTLTHKDIFCQKEDPAFIQAEVRNWNTVQSRSRLWLADKSLDFTNQKDSFGNLDFIQSGAQTLGLTSTSQEGCADTLEKPVFIRPSLRLVSDMETALCLNETYEMSFAYSNAAPISSTWFINNVPQSSASGLAAQFSYKAATVGKQTFSFTHTDLFGCILRSQAAIEVLNLPKASFTHRVLASTPDDVTLLFENTSAGATNYEWQIEDKGSYFEKSPEVFFTDTGSFDVLLLAINSAGCVDSASKVVLVFPEIEFYIPNAITPNSDGLNDVLKMPSPRFIKSLDFKIYNRWGEMVFSTKSPNAEWKPTLMGTYIYTTTIFDLNGKRHILQGVITVIE